MIVQFTRAMYDVIATVIDDEEAVGLEVGDGVRVHLGNGNVVDGHIIRINTTNCMVRPVVDLSGGIEYTVIEK